MDVLTFAADTLTCKVTVKKNKLCISEVRVPLHPSASCPDIHRFTVRQRDMRSTGFVEPCVFKKRGKAEFVVAHASSLEFASSL